MLVSYSIEWWFALEHSHPWVKSKSSNHIWFILQLHFPVSGSMPRNDNLSSYQKILLLPHLRLLLVFPLELRQKATLLFPRFSALFPGKNNKKLCISLCIIQWYWTEQLQTCIMSWGNLWSQFFFSFFFVGGEGGGSFSPSPTLQISHNLTIINVVWEWWVARNICLI